MNTLLNIDPLNIFDELFDTGNLAFRRMRERAAGRFPPVNVYLDQDALIIDVELPGRTAKDVVLTLEAQAVMIADNPAPAEEGKPAAAPKWSRRLELPFRVDEAKANAKFRDGILRIELPRADAVGVRKIAIAD